MQVSPGMKTKRGFLDISCFICAQRDGFIRGKPSTQARSIVTDQIVPQEH
jgi:hypothetical protein